MPSFRKTTDVALDIETAGEILSEIFDEANMNPNSVPLETLDSYSCYRKERFALQRIIIFLIMVLFLLLPILFLAPKLSVSQINEKDAIFPSYQISVNALLPIQSVTAEIDGANVPVVENDSHNYMIKPSVNGKLKVTVTLVNRQRSTESITVESIDSNPPTMLSNSTDSSGIHLYLSDDDSGINYEGIKAIDQNGNSISPKSLDTSAGLVTFDYPTTSLEVYIPDYAGNTLKLRLTVK